MQKPAFIVGTVGLLSVAETLLLFSIAVPANWETLAPRGHQIVALIVGFLLIPALATYFSLLNYGRQQWAKRTVRIFLAPVLLLIVALSVLVALEQLLERTPYLRRDQVFLGFSAVVWLAIGWLIWKGWKTSRRRSDELAAQHWLHERESGITHAQIVRVHRATRVALCLPTVAVLLAFLFIPETYAFVSQVVHGRTQRFLGYKLHLPPTWVVMFSNQDRYVDGISGTGFGRGLFHWIDDRGIPLSSWRFAAYEFALPNAERDDVLGKRFFQLSDGQIVCVEYWPKWAGKRNPRHSWVTCSIPHGAGASFLGEATDVSDFYGVVAKMRESPAPK